MTQWITQTTEIPAEAMEEVRGLTKRTKSAEQCAETLAEVLTLSIEHGTGQMMNAISAALSSWEQHKEDYSPTDRQEAAR